MQCFLNGWSASADGIATWRSIILETTTRDQTYEYSLFKAWAGWRVCVEILNLLAIHARVKVFCRLVTSFQSCQFQLFSTVARTCHSNFPLSWHAFVSRTTVQKPTLLRLVRLCIQCPTKFTIRIINMAFHIHTIQLCLENRERV